MPATFSAAASGGEEEPARPRIDIKPTQLAGGALAAVTSALAASYFGVGGTVIGAAFGSVVSSVAAAVYATSLSHAGERIRTVVVAAPAPRRGRGAPPGPSDPTAVPAELTGPPGPVIGEAVVVEGAAGEASGGQSAARSGGQPPWSLSPAPAPDPARPGGRWGRVAKPALVLGGFAFAASLGAITASEMALGHTVSDTQQTGTSVEQFLPGRAGSGPAETTPAETPASGSTAPSGTSSESGSASTGASSPAESSPADGSADSAPPSGPGADPATGSPDQPAGGAASAPQDQGVPVTSAGAPGG